MRRSLQKFSQELDRRVAEYQSDLLFQELERLISFMNEGSHSDEDIPEEIGQDLSSKPQEKELLS